MIKAVMIIAVAMLIDAWLITACMRMEKKRGEDFNFADSADNSSDRD